jgi:type III secretory pathway lipoprotein EscJ
VQKAAVLVKYKLNSGGEIPFKEDAIRILVANSIEKLEPKDVVVVGTEVGAQSFVPAGAAQASYVYLGPLKLAPDSLALFKILAVAVLVIIALLAMGLILSARKSSSLKARSRDCSIQT